MPYANVGSSRIHYVEQGAGSPLFLLHGNAGSGQVWRKVMPHLAKSFRVIAHDRRGFGDSDISKEGEFGPRAYAGELAGLMDALDIQKAHVCGLSFGGMVAQCFALDHPDRVNGLVLVATTPDRTGRNVKEAVAELERDGWEAFAERLTRGWFRPESDPDDIAETYQIALKSPQWMRKATMIELGEFNIKSEVRNIRAPTLVLEGEKDTNAPAVAGHAKLLRDLIPGARLETITNSAHLIPMDQPEKFCECVVPFLRAVDRGA